MKDERAVFKHIDVLAFIMELKDMSALVRQRHAPEIFFSYIQWYCHNYHSPEIYAVGADSFFSGRLI